MKYYLIIILINLFTLNNLFPNELIQDDDEGGNNQNEQQEPQKYSPSPSIRMGYSFLVSTNINIGFDLLFTQNWEPLFRQIIGLNYQYLFLERDSILGIDLTCVLGIPSVGLSNRYNINKKEYIIAPKIGIDIFFLSLDYRYNIILNNISRNYHELIFSLIIPFYLFKN